MNLGANVQIPENMPVGTFVFDVDVLYGQNWNQVVAPEHTFSVDNPAAFYINETTGEISFEKLFSIYTQ